MDQEHRLYVVDKLWEVRVNSQDSGFNCHLMDPGKEYYHRISTGEIYLFHDNECFCLNCAIRKGILSTTRPMLGEPKYTFINAPPEAEGSADVLKIEKDAPAKDS